MNEQRWYKNKKILAMIGLVIAAIVITPTITTVIAQTNDNATQSQQTQQMQQRQIPKIQGSVNVENEILSKIGVSFSNAANAAANAVGNGKVLSGKLAVVQNSLVYVFMVLDTNNKLHTVIVDAGNGNVLYNSNPMDVNILHMLSGPKSMHTKLHVHRMTKH